MNESLNNLLSTLESEPVLEGSIFKALGFWTGLTYTLWMVLHPWENARETAKWSRKVTIARIRWEL